MIRATLKALTALGFGLALSSAAAWADCGPTTGACTLEGGEYHAVLSAGTPKGAMMFLHGLGSSGQGSLRMRGMADSFTSRGFVVISPDGSPRFRGRLGWDFRGSFGAGRDDHAFLRAVRDDAAARFGFDADNVMLAGFSLGAFMVTYTACNTPGEFAAYAPIAGTFWRPQPESCAGPVKLLQTHGWKDGTVPLEGRFLRGDGRDDPNAFIQGDVFFALDLFRETNACTKHNPDRMEITDRFWRRIWESCVEGSALELAVHQGGHSVPRGWAELALDWFEAETLSN